MFYQCTVDKRFKVNFAIFACPEGAIFHEKEGECSRNETAANDREGCTNFQLEEIPDSVQIVRAVVFSL
ncbi:hypothetical protein WH47_11244 [Habropoda laboriosa]|uniref:Chitin-binding type-2 domain-containing protein n=1 Tax=Habropoda laboriosa TaxID=597456 RepID=A0A0L7QKK8_9HYME|nr:hypothetical protein WH47_11244 [Habropoda laboriosa]